MTGRGRNHRRRRRFRTGGCRHARTQYIVVTWRFSNGYSYRHNRYWRTLLLPSSFSLDPDDEHGPRRIARQTSARRRPDIVVSFFVVRSRRRDGNQ